MQYRLRQFRDADAEALADLCLAAIREIGARYYSAEQVAAWAHRHPGPAMYRSRAAAGHRIWVAVNRDDRPVAYTLLEQDGHLDRLYVHPQHAGNGLAADLLGLVEDQARALGIACLHTEASEAARPVFARLGYTVVRRREFSIAHDGREVPIHNYAMKRPLA